MCYLIWNKMLISYLKMALNYIPSVCNKMFWSQTYIVHCFKQKINICKSHLDLQCSNFDNGHCLYSINQSDIWIVCADETTSQWYDTNLALVPGILCRIVCFSSSVCTCARIGRLLITGKPIVSIEKQMHEKYVPHTYLVTCTCSYIFG